MFFFYFNIIDKEREMFLNINKNYGIELNLFYKCRSFSDGINFFDFSINWDKYLADHKPSFRVSLMILNTYIFEFQIYYKYHRNDI